MNLEEIKTLIDLLEGTDISEIDVEEEGTRVKIKKGITAEDIDNIPAAEVQKPEEPAPAPETEAAPETEQPKEDKEEIVAPMVGTFYRASSPEAEPFVEVGDIINPGTTLCIVEAMKLMNEIEAETRGKIVEILVDDGEPVEYGQPLFLVEKL